MPPAAPRPAARTRRPLHLAGAVLAALSLVLALAAAAPDAEAAVRGYSMTSAGRSLYGTTVAAAPLDVLTTSPVALRSVRLTDGSGRDLGTTTTIGRDDLGQWTAAHRVDLAAQAGSSVRLYAQLTFTNGSTHRIETLVTVARATATPSSAPTSPSAPTPAPTATATRTATPSPTSAAPAPTAPPTTPTSAPSPSTTTSPAPVPPAPSAPSGRVVDPRSYGAVGDGRADDTAALRRALAALVPGDVLQVAAGRTYRHTDVLRVTTPRVTLTGGGTVLATNEQASSVMVQADGVVLRDVTFRLTGSTRRLGTWEQMKVTVLDADDVTVSGITVDGSAAAGLYLWGAQRFSVSDVTITGTRADGLHITGPSADGTVRHVTVTGSGDDGVAVVSYQQDRVPVRRITIDQPTVLGTTWGRGVSVVGGEDITVTGLRVERSACAAVYVAQEGAPWNTFAPQRVRITGGTIVGANTSTTVDHGAVLVWDGGGAAGGVLSDVTISGLSITDTRAAASRQVGFLRGPGATGAGVRITDLSVVRGPSHLFTVTAPAGTWSTSGWTDDGAPVPARG